MVVFTGRASKIGGMSEVRVVFQSRVLEVKAAVAARSDA